MKVNSFYAAVFLIAFFFVSGASAQDVRSVTGLPIPIGQPVIWGQIELKGLKPGERKPIVNVLLMIDGAERARTQINDEGYYYFLQRARDGQFLVVSIGGNEIGRQMVSVGGGERYDMAINWGDGQRSDSAPGVVSVKDAYTGRSEANNKLFDQATAAAKAKKTGEAIKLFDQIVAKDPKDFVAWTEIGTLHFGNNKLSDAEKAYTKALEQKPDFAIALVNLGKVQFSQNKNDEAIATLTKAVEAEPNSPEANHFLGEAYLKARKGSLAVGYLNKAIELAPIEKAEVHLRLAALYNAANMKDRALAEYKAFLEKVKEHPERSKIEQFVKDNS